MRAKFDELLASASYSTLQLLQELIKVNIAINTKGLQADILNQRDELSALGIS